MKKHNIDLMDETSCWACHTICIIEGLDLPESRVADELRLVYDYASIEYENCPGSAFWQRFKLLSSILYMYEFGGDTGDRLCPGGPLWDLVDEICTSLCEALESEHVTLTAVNLKYCLSHLLAGLFPMIRTVGGNYPVLLYDICTRLGVVQDTLSYPKPE